MHILTLPSVVDAVGQLIQAQSLVFEVGLLRPHWALKEIQSVSLL